MRLLDYVAQGREPFRVVRPDGTVWRLPSAVDFAAEVAACPLRYVLTDELTRACTALAYSEGHSLSDCLDLLRVPSERLWVEWADEPRRLQVPEVVEASGIRAGAPAVRVGALIRASRNGRSGRMRTFFTTRAAPDDPMVAALETHFDFDGEFPPSGGLESLLDGDLASLPASGFDGLEPLLHCVRYRFDPAWCSYHQQDRGSPELRAQVIRASLATVAHDLPVLMALSLLLATRGGLPATATNLSRLNAKRRRLGRAPLLEHIEVSVPLFAAGTDAGRRGDGDWRQAPRFHHVRGHLVRRANVVYWRAPHWRGHLRLGRVRSRTVTLAPSAADRPGLDDPRPLAGR